MSDAVAQIDRALPGAVVEQDQPMVNLIERLAMSPDVPIDRLERMLEMKERMDAQAREQAFNAAFTAASAEFPGIPKKGRGHNRMPYAKLEDIISATRPVLAAHGMALNWDTEVSQDTVTVTAILAHRDGHSRKTVMQLPHEKSGHKNVVQAVGSSQTYGQRYTAQAILGLSLGDDTEDDGRGATSKDSTISEDQFRRLKAMLSTVDDNAEDQLLVWAKVDTLHSLPESKFREAVEGLKRRGAQTPEPAQ